MHAVRWTSMISDGLIQPRTQRFTARPGNFAAFHVLQRSSAPILHSRSRRDCSVCATVGTAIWIPLERFRTSPLRVVDACVKEYLFQTTRY